MTPLRTLLLACSGLLATAACAGAPPATDPGASPSRAGDPLLQEFVDEAAALRSLFATSAFVQRFLDEAARIAPRAPRTVMVKGEPKALDETYYYAERWGTPLSYARILELAEGAGAKTGAGARWLDFGFGAPGHLQMLGRLGLDVVGVDVDEVGAQLYTDPSDVAVAPGHLALRFGRWPAEAAVRAAVGGDFDVIMSKNVLKRGYIHPAREADPKHLVQLGVDDATFLATLHDSLKPGGLAVIWNLCPAQAPADKPYIPWADGESPWSQAEWEAAGFDVVALSVDDTERAHALAKALAFDAPDPDGTPGWDIEHDLHAWITIARRRP